MSIKAYWRECGPRAGNFGDNLVPHILRHVYRTAVERATEFKDADLISLGSILGEIPNDYSGTIWGTGFMFFHEAAIFPNARIAAVRGLLTSHRIQRETKPYFALGDPGMFACELCPKPSRTRWPLGLIPHYVDWGNDPLHKWAAQHAYIRVIDPCQHPLMVLNEMAMCDRILSSSLHGLISADSLGIPAWWMYLSNQVQGGDFKFRDYLSLFGVDDPRPWCFSSDWSVDWVMGTLDKQPARRHEPFCSSLRAALMECCS